jgi:Transposase, Mutator family
VSRICEDTRERYRQWCRRRLEQHDVVYLFLDAIYLKLRPDDALAEGVLVRWGVTLEGRKVLLGLALGSRESYDSWLSFGRDMIGLGWRAPALVIADGAPGIWKAVRELWPTGVGAALHRSRLAERHQQAPPRGWPSSKRICQRSSPTCSFALSLIWAVPELSSRGWRGVKMNPRPSPRSSVSAASRATPRLHQPHEHRGSDRRITFPLKRSYPHISPQTRAPGEHLQLAVPRPVGAGRRTWPQRLPDCARASAIR